VGKLLGFIGRVAEEPPFRLLTRAVLKTLPVSARTKARWDIAPRPQYLAGVLAAADEAAREGVREISVYEFGVAGGNGLLALGDCAAEVQEETGIKIAVYGFDSGRGLVELTGDYRDHPDEWQPGDYPMNEDALRKRLRPNTTLVIGPVSQTVPKHIPKIPEPIGFVSVDVDTYSATQDVLRMFTLPGTRMLRRVVIYCDDVDLMFNHKFAGELFAIREFNLSNEKVKIDRWRSIRKQRPFPEESWLGRMFIAHHVEAISNYHPDRAVKVITVEDTTGATG